MFQETPDEPRLDDITGVPVEEEQNKEDTDQIVRVIQQGQAFRDLVVTPGWKIVEEFVQGQVASLTQILKVERNFDKIIRIQSELLAFESLLLIVEKAFLDHEEALRRIKIFINEDPKG